jgi:serine protease
VKQSILRSSILASALALTLTANAQDEFSRSADVKINATSLVDEMPYDQVIVYFDVFASRSQDEINAKLVQASANAKLDLTFVRTISTGGHLVKIARPSGNTKGEKISEDAKAVVDDADTLNAMRALAALSDVVAVEPDAMMQAFLSPNDTDYASRQWHYFETTGGLNLPSAWDQATGSGVTVAVLDTGITSHTDLNANVVAGYDFVSNATNAVTGAIRIRPIKAIGTRLTNAAFPVLRILPGMARTSRARSLL